MHSSAISKSYESPKRFVRWQPVLVRPSCQFVFRQAIGGRRFPVSTRFASVDFASLAGRKICFHESHINLAVNVVPLGSYFGGCPPPPVTFRQRGPDFSERHGSPPAGPSQWLLPVFIRAPRNVLRLSLAGFSASTKSVIATANRSAFALSQSLATPFAVSSSVATAVTVVTVWFIPKRNFSIKISCVLFFE